MKQQTNTTAYAQGARQAHTDNNEKRGSRIILHSGDPIKWSDHERIKFSGATPKRIVLRAG